MPIPVPLDAASLIGRSTAEGGPVLICRVRGLWCALPLSHVVETMRPQPLETLASAPSFVLGVAIIRGAPTPVVDVGALLGSADPPLATRFITLSVAKRAVAVAVEGIVGVRVLPGEALGDLPPLLRDAKVDVIAAVGTLDSALLVVLRAARILPEALWSDLLRTRSST